MSKVYVLVPRRISSGVLRSQIIDKFDERVRYCSFNPISRNAIEAIPEVKPVNDLRSGDRVYVRSALEFLFLYLSQQMLYRKKLYVVFDFRGLISKESFMRNRSKLRRLVLLFLEWFAIKFSDEVWTVSNALRDYLILKYKYKKQISVFPCGVKKHLVRKRMSRFDSKVRFVYVGSMSVWQCFSEVCRVYKTVENESTTLDVYTKDTEQAERLLRQFGITSVIVKSLSREQVLSELNKADFGFLLRADNVVNRTASPVKFCEYISQGVVPIMTSYVGDYSELSRGLSVIVDEENATLDIKELEQRLNDETYGMLYQLAIKISAKSELAGDLLSARR